jgi:hypothetical protein
MFRLGEIIFSGLLLRSFAFLRSAVPLAVIQGNRPIAAGVAGDLEFSFKWLLINK